MTVQHRTGTESVEEELDAGLLGDVGNGDGLEDVDGRVELGVLQDELIL